MAGKLTDALTLWAERTAHDLKTDPVCWDAIRRGEKTFEVRRNDRHFQRGDLLRLYRSVDHIAWQAAPVVFAHVGWTLTGGQFGIEPGYVVFSLEGVHGADQVAALANDGERR